MSIRPKQVTGLGLGGSRKEDSFIVDFEYLEHERHWILKTVYSLKERVDVTSDDLLLQFLQRKSSAPLLVVDFPLSPSFCDSCQLVCPGEVRCHHPDVVRVKEMMKDLLGHDERLFLDNPKKYERERNDEELINLKRDELKKPTDDHLLSKAFKRKLKKEITPYWHRPIDYWIWKSYYDPMLSIFKQSYDSYGQFSVMLMARLRYLGRHFPHNLEMTESNTRIVLLELYRAEIVTLEQIKNLMDLEQAALARIEILRNIEQKLKIFIYEKDFISIVKSPKAFESFLLGLSGIRYRENSFYQLPDWTKNEQAKFIAPHFLSEIF